MADNQGSKVGLNAGNPLRRETMREDLQKDLARRKNEIIESGEIKFDYIKSNYFRVLHIDGAWGGVTPKLMIRMAVFNERSAIPKEVVQQVNAEGNLGDEIIEKRIARDAIVREVEADLVMDLPTAKSLMYWLQDKIDAVESILKEKGST
jgi:hypothetical protein